MHFAEKHLEICREVRAGTAPLAASFLFGFSLHCEILNGNLPVVKVTPVLNLFLFQIGDRSGELTARMNVSDLQTVLGLSYSTNNSTLSENREVDYTLHGTLVQTHSPLTV